MKSDYGKKMNAVKLLELELEAKLEIPDKIAFGYQAAKVKFINYFTIKNTG